MIRTLRSRERVDTLATEVRVTRLQWGRYVYASLLGVFALGLANYIGGSSVFFRAEGLVIRARVTVAPPYEGKIVTVTAEPGSVVMQGDVLAHLQSSTLARSLADLSLRRAEITSKLEQLKSKLAISETMLPLARIQVDEMDRSARNVELLKQQQLTNQKRVEDLMNTRYSVRAQLVELQAEKASLAREIAVNERANEEADSTYSDLKQLYNSGVLTAPVSGTVGPEVAAPGSVLVPGDKVLEIYAGAPYVMAYMPDSYLFELKQFEKVVVSSGRERAVGRIDEILPLADNLPVEFQNTFRPRDRSQLIRISLGAGQPFPARQKVVVTACSFENCEPFTWVASQYGLQLFRQAQQYIRPMFAGLADFGRNLRARL